MTSLKASLLSCLLLGCALCAAPALANGVPPSPLIGRWLLDPGTLPMPPEMRPKRVELEFASTPDRQWSTRVDIVGPDGKPLHSTSTLSLDGTPGQASGTCWVDVIAAKMPAPNVLVMQFVYEGVPRSTRVYSVGADRNTLTETEVYAKPDGTPVLRTALFKRAATQP